MATLAEQYMDFYAQQELEKNAGKVGEMAGAAGSAVKGHLESVGKGAAIGTATAAQKAPAGSAIRNAGNAAADTMIKNKGATGGAAYAAGGAALGGAALLARKLMKQSPGQKLVGALKKNRGAIAAGGAGAAGLGALAAFRKKDK